MTGLVMSGVDNSHEQVWGKVNAPLDRGIRSLVEALSLFPQLETIESCEGSPRDGLWICFRYGAYWENPWRDLCEFVFGYLGPGLAHEIGDRASVSVQVSTFGEARGELVTRRGAERRVVAALKRLSRAHDAWQDVIDKALGE